MSTDVASFLLAQRALADLKGSVLQVVAAHEGLSNSEIGRALGIYAGHKGHEGHISRTILAMLEDDGVLVQDVDTKKWFTREPKRDRSSI